MRLWAIYSLAVSNKPIAEATKMFDPRFSTIKNSYRRFRGRGIDGLDDKPRSGRPRTPKPETLDRHMRSHGSPIRPSEPTADIKNGLGADTSACSVRQQLGSPGRPCKTPSPIHAKRAPFADVLLWQEETKSWVSRLHGAQIPAHAIDRTMLLRGYRRRRDAWAPIGERACAPYCGDRAGSAICGGVSTGGLRMFRACDRSREREAVDCPAGLHARHGKRAVLRDILSVHASGPSGDT